MNVLSIQSHVAWGHVGNRSAVFPLERMGIDVWPIHTVQFSSHTGYPKWTGTVFPPEHIADVALGIERLGVFPTCDAVLSGYIGDPGTGEAILSVVDAVKKANPAALYCCDPVMGDVPEGLYVRTELPGFMVKEAMPRSDIVTPNIFEAGILSGITIQNGDSARKAADIIHERGPRIVVFTSYRISPADGIGFFLSDGSVCMELSTPMLPFNKPPKGSGDLFCALFLGNFLLKRDPAEALCSAASTLYAVLEATLSLGRPELAIVAAQASISSLGHRFEPRIIS